MPEENNGRFVDEITKFYKKLFVSISDSIKYLADIQKSYPTQYEKITEFSQNPRALEELIKKLPVEKQATLFRLLFKAGEFGRRFATLMESSEEEKRTFVKDLKTFAKELEKILKKS